MVEKPEAVWPVGARAAVVLVAWANSKEEVAPFWSTYLAVRVSPICARVRTAPDWKPALLMTLSCTPWAQVV
jgi:hypothetical protein